MWRSLAISENGKRRRYLRLVAAAKKEKKKIYIYIKMATGSEGERELKSNAMV